jgi:hypothetical protein
VTAKKRTQALVPAASRLTHTITDQESALADEGVAVFEQIIGGRKKLTDALAVASTDADVARVTDLLLDPRYERHNLRSLCKMVGLTVADLLTAYRKAAIIQAHIQSAPIIAGKLIGVVEDLMTRAQPHYLPCPICRGTGTVVPEPTRDNPNPSPRPCQNCVDGQVYTLPDLDRQKLALEISELIKPRAGITLNQANIVGSGNGGGDARALGGSLEQLQQAVSDVLFPSNRSRAPVGAAIDAPTVDVIDAPLLDHPPSDLRIPTTWTEGVTADE